MTFHAWSKVVIPELIILFFTQWAFRPESQPEDWLAGARPVLLGFGCARFHMPFRLSECVSGRCSGGPVISRWHGEYLSALRHFIAVLGHGRKLAPQRRRCYVGS